MDKNTVTGLVLMVALVMGYNWYYAPTEEEIAARKAAAEAEAIKENSESEDVANETIYEEVSDSLLSSDLIRLKSEFGHFAQASIGESSTEAISSEKLLLEFSNQGAMPTSATLIDGNTKYGGEDKIQIWDPTPFINQCTI